MKISVLGNIIDTLETNEEWAMIITKFQSEQKTKEYVDQLSKNN